MCFFWQPLMMTCTFVLPRGIAQPSHKTLKKFDHVVKTFTVSMTCHYADKRFMNEIVGQIRKKMMVNIYWENSKTTASMMSGKRANTSSLTLRWRVEVAVFRFQLTALDPLLLVEQFDILFGSLNGAAKPIVPISFVFKKEMDDHSGYNYINEFSALVDQSKLIASKKNLTNNRTVSNFVCILHNKMSKQKRKPCKLSNASFLLHFSRKFMWGVKELFFQNFRSRFAQSFSWLWWTTPKIQTTIISVSSVLGSSTAHTDRLEKSPDCLIPSHKKRETLMQPSLNLFVHFKI